MMDIIKLAKLVSEFKKDLKNQMVRIKEMEDIISSHIQEQKKAVIMWDKAHGEGSIFNSDHSPAEIKNKIVEATPKRTQKMTIREMAIDVGETDKSFMQEELRKRVKEKYGTEVNRNTFGTTMALLRRQGIYETDVKPSGTVKGTYRLSEKAGKGRDSKSIGLRKLHI